MKDIRSVHGVNSSGLLNISEVVDPINMSSEDREITERKRQLP